MRWISELSIPDHEVSVIQCVDGESLVQAEAQGRIEAFTIAVIPAIVSLALSPKTI
jgi:hypothetical protein